MKSDGKTYRIPVSTGIFPHYWQIKDALWLFLWYIDKTTKEVGAGEECQVGLVLGGMPVRDRDRAGTFGCSAETIRNWRRRLAREGYIEQRRTPFGYVIKVLKSKKWQGERSVKNYRSPATTDVTPKVTPKIDESDRYQVANPIGNDRPSDRYQAAKTKKTIQDITEDKTNSPLPVRPNGGKAVMFSKSEHDPVSLSSRGNGKPNSKLEKAMVPLGRKKGMASYEPPTDAELEQRRQNLLRQGEEVKAKYQHGERLPGRLTCSKNPIPEASASD